jgi:hypothetical protein
VRALCKVQRQASTLFTHKWLFHKQIHFKLAIFQQTTLFKLIFMLQAVFNLNIFTRKIMKKDFSLFIILSTVALSSCQLISPMITNYNGVRRDVAAYINSNLLFSLKDREILVNYAKGQQQILTADRLSPTAQQNLALERAEGRYCASQHISLKKLNLVDHQIFALPEHQANWQHIQNLQMQINLTPENMNCEGKF